MILKTFKFDYDSDVCVCLSFVGRFNNLSLLYADLCLRRQRKQLWGKWARIYNSCCLNTGNYHITNSRIWMGFILNSAFEKYNNNISDKGKTMCGGNSMRYTLSSNVVPKENKRTSKNFNLWITVRDFLTWEKVEVIISNEEFNLNFRLEHGTSNRACDIFW